MKIRHIIYLVILIVLIGGVFSTFEQIEAGQRGVVKRLGQVNRVLDPGFHIVNPITEDVIVMDVRIQLATATEDSSSKDLQEVTSTVQVNYHLMADKVDELYESVGKDAYNRLIAPAVKESVKSATALFTAEEQINKRSEVKEAIKRDLKPRLESFFVVLDDVSIADFSFSSEFDKAIELKQIAEQDAKRAENELEKVKFEQQQAIEKAKAEAESTRLQVEALRNSAQIIELRKAEAFLEFAKKWNGTVPSTMIVGDGGALPILNLK